MTDFLIVGAGLFGATCARILTNRGYKVQIIEKRRHIGGNCYDIMTHGVPVGNYGGHIFHTNNNEVWKFVNEYATWLQYEHRVKSKYNGRTYSLPPNLTTFEQFGVEPGEQGEQVIREALFDGYSLKQWGKPFDQLPASVKKRVPFRYNYDDRYFTDRYQGVPEMGYTAMIREIIGSIPVLTGVSDFIAQKDYWCKQADKVIYSGPIDEFFGCDLGKLKYRSLSWKTELIDAEDYQGCATINYPDVLTPFTRVLEWRHFGWRPSIKGKTMISMEIPSNFGDPYYPVADNENLALYQAYRDRAHDIPWLIVGGRLGSYRYMNMDQTIAQAFHKVDTLGGWDDQLIDLVSVNTTSATDRV